MSDSNVHLVNPPGAGPIWRVDLGSGAGAARDLLNFQAGSSEVFSVDANGLPDPGGGDATQSVDIPLGDIVADSDAIPKFLFEAIAAITITAIKYAVDTATADGSANGQTMTVKRSTDDAQVAQVATPTANPGVAQATWTSMGSITNATLAAGKYLYMEFAKVSSGLAMSGLTVRVEFTYAA